MLNRGAVTRRTVLGGLVGSTFGIATNAGRAGAQAARPPNIVFILADDMGYADVSCYGRRDLTTPNIDFIAARGMRFLQAYANSAVCTASRVALLRYPGFRPAGLPDSPLRHGRPRGLGCGSSDCVSDTYGCKMQKYISNEQIIPYNYGNFSVAI